MSASARTAEDGQRRVRSNSMLGTLPGFPPPLPFQWVRCRPWNWTLPETSKDLFQKEASNASMSRQANGRSRSERSEDARDIRRRGTLGAEPLIRQGSCEAALPERRSKKVSRNWLTFNCFVAEAGLTRLRRLFLLAPRQCEQAPLALGCCVGSNLRFSSCQ